VVTLFFLFNFQFMPQVAAGPFSPLYNPSTPSAEWYINDHCFIRDRQGLWHMFGITHEEPANPTQEKDLAHATSPHLCGPWSQQPYALSAEATPWEERHLWAPHVIWHDGLYYMYYCAGGQRDLHDPHFKIHLATSPDLWRWTRHPKNPLLIDAYHARDPMILQLGPSEWIMYYTATSEPEGGHHTVAAVTSQDLVTWGGKRTVFTSVATGTYGGPTESPFVVRRGSQFYLFAGPSPKPNYIGVDVFVSDTPFHWEASQRVGQISAHASEVVRDGDGQWYISHCGWAQKGLHLAPLTWSDGLDHEDSSLPPSGKA
jgi:beta-fructofuranosidase